MPWLVLVVGLLVAALAIGASLVAGWDPEPSGGRGAVSMGAAGTDRSTPVRVPYVDLSASAGWSLTGKVRCVDAGGVANGRCEQGALWVASARSFDDGAVAQLTARRGDVASYAAGLTSFGYAPVEGSTTRFASSGGDSHLVLSQLTGDALVQVVAPSSVPFVRLEDLASGLRVQPDAQW